MLLEELKDAPHLFRFSLVDHQGAPARAHVITEHRTPAHPSPFLPGGRHLIARSFPDQLPLELGKREQDVQRQSSQRGARVAGKWTYLYRALDSEGNTIDFRLSPYRDRIAVKQFLQLALCGVGHSRPRVIKADGHPAYPSLITELKQTGSQPLAG